MLRSDTHRRGFTLIEILMVVVVIAVAMGMFVPQFVRRISATKLREAGHHLFVMARYAHEFAVTRRCTCRLLIDPKRNRFGLVYQVDPEHRASEYVPMRRDGMRQTTLPQGVRFAEVLADSVANQDPKEIVISFDPTGQATAAIIQLTDGHRTWSIVIEPNRGRVELVDQAINAFPHDRKDLDA